MWLCPLPDCTGSLHSIHWLKLHLDFHKGWPKYRGDILELMGVMMLRYCPLLRWQPHSTSSQHHFPRQAMESDGYSGRHNGHFTAERERLCCGTMGLFREVALLLALLEPAFGLCSQRTFIRPSLVTDMMALCLPTATGHSVGMATIYPIEPSRRALSVAKDAGWAGRVKQLPSTILFAVMSQRQRSAIEQWQLTPFRDSKEKHRNEMGTKIQSHLALMRF